MAKNEHVVLRAAITACVVVALLQVMVYGMGGVINLGKPDIEPYESATIWASLNMLPNVLGALLLAGIVAAILSSASTFLSLVGFSASNDIGLHKSEDERKTLFFSRTMMFVIGSLVLVAAFVFPPNIFWLTTFIATVFASSWGPVGFMSIWSKRITESAAFWGMLSGLVFNVVPKFFEFIGMIDLPSYLDPAVIGAVASLIVTLAVSRITFVSDEEKAYIQKLHETPAEEISSKKTRTTYLASAVLIANGLVMPFVLINYYVRPYQSATGMLSADGSLDWFSGEALLALSWFVLYVPLGVFAMRQIRKAYARG
jgi:sodium/pantothenate symporter